MRITAGRLAAWVYAFFSWLMHGPGVAAAWTWKVADQPAAEVAPPVPAPDVAWRRVAESYRTGPVGERVRIGVMTARPSRPMPDDPDAAAIEEFLRRGGPGGEEQRGVVFLRIADPAAVAAARDGLGEPSLPMAVTSPVRALLTGRVVLLEMGDLRVHAEPGRLMIARRSVPGGVVLRTLDGPITIDHLREVMPPIMLPQLALALGTEDGNEPLVPGLPPVEWETSQRIRESGRPRLVIRGRGGSAAGDWRVEAVIDEATHRLSRVVLTGPAPGSGAGPAGVEWFISPIDPGDPASWRIDTAGRIAVDSIDKLRSAPPAPAVDHSARVQAGERLPPLHLYNAGTEAWANEASSAGRFAGVVPEEMDRFRIALLMYLPAAHANNREARERFR
ncbi:MAG TPA: hypothetical protein PKU91_07030, partial [Phycisphaerales bacterium]|nr:hypothetical protein [Phycisphaerales bacterium]